MGWAVPSDDWTAKTGMPHLQQPATATQKYIQTAGMLMDLAAAAAY